MLQESNIDYSDTCNALKTRLEDVRYKIKTTKVNQEHIKTYNQKIDETHKYVQALDTTNAYLSPIIRDITSYLAARKKQSQQAINSVIRMACEIIPDAMPDIHFEIKGEDAWLQSSDGLLTRLAEGSGYKSILSAFLRTVVLNMNPQSLQTMIFDEPFSKVSVEHSATLSLFLNLMIKNMQIISIEQKPEIYANVNCVNYVFTKQNGYTQITKEYMNNADNLQASGVDTN